MVANVSEAPRTMTMPDEPIRISWDEVNSPEVDKHLKQQELIGRAQEHYQRKTSVPVGAEPMTQSQRPGFWYNALVYMALFGMVGGVLGWLAGEVAERTIPNRLEDFQRVFQYLNQRVAAGLITSQEAEEEFEAFGRAHQDNPYFQVSLDRTITVETRDLRVKEMLKKDAFRNRVQQIIFFCVIAVPLAFCLSIADHVASRNARAVLIDGSMGVVFGIV
jgi:hypothetical protein